MDAMQHNVPVSNTKIFRMFRLVWLVYKPLVLICMLDLLEEKNIIP